jgi:DNA (cytosine-5)-methyltransferase 1
VDSVLKGIPSNAPNHDLAGAHEYARLKGFIIGPQWDSKRIVPKTITTHGGHNYHPSGKRHFTRREFAALQTFPHDHEFIEPNVMKQIGNAVPPLIAQLLFIHLKKALEKADGIKPEVLLIE